MATMTMTAPRSDSGDLWLLMAGTRSRRLAPTLPPPQVGRASRRSVCVEVKVIEAPKRLVRKWNGNFVRTVTGAPMVGAVVGVLITLVTVLRVPRQTLIPFFSSLSVGNVFAIWHWMVWLFAGQLALAVPTAV